MYFIGVRVSLLWFEQIRRGLVTKQANGFTALGQHEEGCVGKGNDEIKEGYLNIN